MVRPQLTSVLARDNRTTRRKEFVLTKLLYLQYVQISVKPTKSEYTFKTIIPQTYTPVNDIKNFKYYYKIT